MHKLIKIPRVIIFLYAIGKEAYFCSVEAELLYWCSDEPSPKLISIEQNIIGIVFNKVINVVLKDLYIRFGLKYNIYLIKPFYIGSMGKMEKPKLTPS